MKQTFSIKTLGCKLNQYDSAMIAERFINGGWEARPFGERVDVVIVNTCSVTDRSEKKCRNYIRQGADFSKSGKVFVTGCMADSGAAAIDAMPEACAVFKNSDKDNIFHSITGMGGLEAQNALPLPFFHTRGFVKIQDGCDGGCSYCIVPSVRGVPVSRASKEILEHAKRLIDSGCPEIVLTGITIGKYCADGMKLSSLVEAMASLDGEFRIRITSIEPTHVDDGLIQLFSHKKVCGHIHLPLQSGSDKILKLMNRPYTAAGFMSVVEAIRKTHPDISIGSDVIVGFPGESSDDFNSTLDIVKAAGFSYLHQFTFSARSGTGASTLDMRAPLCEITSRSAMLREAAGEISAAYREKFVGKVLDCVIEKKRGALTGISDNYIKIDVKRNSAAGRGPFYKVKLVDIAGNKNIGVLVG